MQLHRHGLSLVSVNSFRHESKAIQFENMGYRHMGQLNENIVETATTINIWRSSQKAKCFRSIVSPSGATAWTDFLFLGKIILNARARQVLRRRRLASQSLPLEPHSVPSRSVSCQRAILSPTTRLRCATAFLTIVAGRTNWSSISSASQSNTIVICGRGTTGHFSPSILGAD